MRPSSSLALAVALTSVAVASAFGVRRRMAPRVEVSRADSGLTGSPPREKAPAPGVQQARGGAGPLMHRTYGMDLPAIGVSASELLQAIGRRLERLSPATLAEFEKRVGHRSTMRVGDEYHIRILGPWNGRVRVSRVSDTAFTLVTLRGHPEAGQITFRVRERRSRRHPIEVTIESWARARDGMVGLAYGALGIGKQVQAEVWVTFLHRIAKMAGVTRTPRVHIRSERVDA